MLCEELHRAVVSLLNRSEYGYRKGNHIVAGEMEYPCEIFCHAYLEEKGLVVVGKSDYILVHAEVAGGRYGTNRLHYLLQWFPVVILCASVLGRNPTYVL